MSMSSSGGSKHAKGGTGSTSKSDSKIAASTNLQLFIQYLNQLHRTVGPRIFQRRFLDKFFIYQKFI